MGRSRALAVLLALLFVAPARAGDDPAAQPPRTIEDLLAALDPDDAWTRELARTLDTLAGRAALDLAVEAAAEERETRTRREAYQSLVRSIAADEALGRRLAHVESEWAEDVALLEATVDNLRRNLRGDSVLTEDLRTFLARDDAARLLYRVLVRPRLRPWALQAVLAECLAADDAGRLFVPSALRDASARALARDERVRRALLRLGTEAAALAERPEYGDLPGDEVGRAVLLSAADGWKDDPLVAAGQLLAGEVRAVPRLRPSVLEAMRADATENLRVARAYAAALRPDDPSLDAWRDLLASPRALLLAPRGRLAQGKPVDVLLNRTGFGRALVTHANGTVEVNRHALWDLDRILQSLGRSVERGRDALLEQAAWEAKGRRVEPLAAWAEEVCTKGPGGLVLCPDGMPPGLETVEIEIASGAHVRLDPEALAWQTTSLDLLRASIFYNPRTAYGARLWSTTFEDHRAARLFGTFGWNAKVSKDLDDFRRRIRAQKESLERLAETHDKLIVPIAGVPPWLSSWEGAGTFEGGGWEDKQAHPPRDLETWKAMVEALAETFREVDGVERYYEFWNEPDLEYWQGSLKDFLALYEATATTIRRVDPEGRIGGCAVNRWDARIHGKKGSDVLTHELIRFAAKRDLPLDFVSWHHFGRLDRAIADARSSYRAELAKNDFDDDVELLVTEWSAPGRCTPYGNTAFAETMLALFQAGVDAQTASCWEEFHAKPDPGGFAPWGLMTQQGERHGTWTVHRFFDRLARGSRGVAVQRGGDGTVAVVSRKDDGVYDLLVWRTDAALPMTEAWKVLLEAGYTREDARAYGTLDRLERTLREGYPVPERWTEAFAKARAAYEGTGPQRGWVEIELVGASRIDVLFAESVRTEHATKRVACRGSRLACPLQPYEVLRLLVRVTPE